MQLNMDLSNVNPVQNEGMFATVPLPSAHLVTIVEDELKKSVDNSTGFEKGENLVLHCQILHSSTGNEFAGQKLGLYIPIRGQESAISAGQRRIAALTHTLGLGNYISNSEQLHNIPFIVVLEKDSKGGTFPNFKKILRTDGAELADVSGNFKPCEMKDTQSQAELYKLLEALNGGNNNPQQSNNAPQQQNTAPQGFGAAQQQTTSPAQNAPTGNWGNAVNPANGAPTAPQGFGAAQQQTNNGSMPNFGGAPQQQNTAPAGNWIPQNGQAPNA